MVKVFVHRLPHGKDLPPPAYQSLEAAGLDLPAANEADQPVVLKPGERALIPTGLSLELPPGFEAQIRPRSGLALRHGVTVLNSPGTIDSDYRGEIKVLLINHGEQDFVVNRGERIAQLVLSAICRAELTETRQLHTSNRGSGGFGSTGTGMKKK